MTANRIRILMSGLAFTAATVAAQAPAPAPLAPPAPPAAVRPVAPAPAPVVDPFNFSFDFGDLGVQIAQAQTDRLRDLGVFQLDVAEQARQAAEQAREQVQLAFQGPKFQIGRGIGAGIGGRGDDGIYANGQRALDRSQWDEALGDFNRVAANGGQRAEGALYWKAYTLNKLGRRDEARAALAELRKSYPMSRWLDDANALEMEIQQSAGQNVSPESQPDEELKLIAVNTMVRSDPDRAFPILENLLKSAQSPRLKERALFVLSQTDAPRAQQLLEQVARGGGNPDLQVTAINYLGPNSRKKGNNSQVLFDIYNSSSDVNVKRAALNGLRAAGDTDHLVQAVKSEKSVDLRSEGVRMLGGRPETGDALVALYGTEQDAQVKRAIADSLSSQHNAKALIDLARKETNRETKLDLVRRISNMQSKEATDYMLELLK